MMSIVALPSGSVFTSRLPISLPSLKGLKITAAFIIGLPFDFFVTSTVIFDVSGGGLYLRPRFTGESCANRLEVANRAVIQTTETRDQRERGNDIVAFILRRRSHSWLSLGLVRSAWTCASFTHISSP